MPNMTKEMPKHYAEAYGTQTRRKTRPENYFLLVDEGNRKFPYRDPSTGEISCELLRTAITRAAQYGYKEVEEKAKSLYDIHFKEKQKELRFVVAKDFQGIVLGIVAEPDAKPDVDGHTISKEAVQSTCWEYNKNFQTIAYRHSQRFTKDEAQLLESYIAPVDFEIEKPDGSKGIIKEGTWLMRWEIYSPELKEQVKSGFIKGFSLGGFIEALEPI
jgi:hypothetical protein